MNPKDSEFKITWNQPYSLTYIVGNQIDEIDEALEELRLADSEFEDANALITRIKGKL